MPTALYRFRPYFYPRPPRGGRQLRFVVHCQGSLFLSTPSARRATHPCRGAIPAGSISIHALREEGDRATARRYPFSGDFYPRPPRGGRRSRWRRSWWHQQFLSTPSARRATERPCASSRSCHISIHALREEGDTECICRIHQMHQYFYPRPPRGGRPQDEQYRIDHRADFYPRPPRGGRLPSLCHSQKPFCDFYPRPPRGGRRSSPPPGHRWSRYFYPRPPRGGRRLRSLSNLLSHLQNFYPRPPRGGRHFLTEDEDVINGFLSTPSARRATLQRGFDNQSVIFLSTPSARRATARRSTSP